MFRENFARAETQQQRAIRVIVGNPPYSVGQRSENDANKNTKYPNLDATIRNNYSKHSIAILKKSLYDSYIRAIRWASERIGDEGIICYVSNSSYIDSNTTDGMRKTLADEFSSIYCFDLRGNIRKNMAGKDTSEGENIFGQASMAGVVVTLFVKRPSVKDNPANIYYYNIGDNLKRGEKLERIAALKSMQHKDIAWQTITPNAQYDWINQRHPEFKKYLPLGTRGENKKTDINPLFLQYKNGVSTNRNAWAYNFSAKTLTHNMLETIQVYNDERTRYETESMAADSTNINIDKFVTDDKTKISWSRDLKRKVVKNLPTRFNKKLIRQAMYRPFLKNYFYADEFFPICPQ